MIRLIQVILLDKKSEAENTPKGGLTSVTAPAHPYATDAVVYTALFFDVFAFLPFALFVADGINSVGDYNLPPGGCRLYVCMYVCVSPLFFTFHDGITSKRFELSG